MMRLDYQIIPCRSEHIDYLSDHMPAVQRRELTIWDIDPRKAILSSWQQSRASWCLLLNGDIAAGYGVTGSLLDREWGGWLVTTALFRIAQPLGLVRGGRRELRRVAEGRTIKAICPAFYESSIHFLELIGFETTETVYAPTGDDVLLLRYTP